MDPSIPRFTTYNVEEWCVSMSQQRIRILPEHLANQIAAGEVVQRPESVVKELVENAIDAGATSITVIVHDGGLRSIQVVDNGHGMSREDLELSVVRHATSKIVHEEDLHAIQTLGFRGEALASIAAVAEVEIATAQQGESHGWTLYSRPGNTPTCTASPSRIGTSINVMNLFANVPARRKFLKSALTEFRYISETLQKLAISRPDVRFVLYDGASIVLDLAVESVERRLSNVLRNTSVDELIPVECQEQGIWVKGFVASQHASRKNRSGQFLFLNGRCIQSKSLSYAVVQCFEHLVQDREHPVFALWFDIDPERIDVNIHPQKHEVKFDDERSVFLLIQKAVTDALTSAKLIPQSTSFIPLAQTPLQSLHGLQPGQLAVNRFTGEILDTVVPATSPGGSRTLVGQQRYDAPSVSSEMHNAYAQLVTNVPAEPELGVLFVERGMAFSRHHDGIMVVRLFPAMERVFFEQILDCKRQGAIVAEQLLFPVAITLDVANLALFDEHAELIASMGYDVHREDQGLTISGVPWFVSAAQEENALQDVLDGLRDLRDQDVNDREEQILIKLARSRAAKASSDVRVEHVQQIITELRNCTISHVSPSGMPTYTIVTIDEFEKRLQ